MSEQCLAAHSIHSLQLEDHLTWSSMLHKLGKKDKEKDKDKDKQTDLGSIHLQLEHKDDQLEVNVVEAKGLRAAGTPGHCLYNT